MKRVASILAFALLMAIRDEFDDRYVRMLIAAAAGVSLALGMVNLRAERSHAPGPTGSWWARGSFLLWITLSLFSVSMLLPVVEMPMNSGYFLGWEAAKETLSPLWNPQDFTEDPWRTLHLFASGLTNVFMVIAVFIQLRQRERKSMYWMWLAWSAVAINASWMCFEGSLKDLRIGYYVWFLSFGILAVSLMPRGIGKEANGAQPSTA